MTFSPHSTPTTARADALPSIIRAFDVLAARVAAGASVDHAAAIVRSISSELAIVDDCVTSTGDEAIEYVRRVITGESVWAPIRGGTP